MRAVVVVSFVTAKRTLHELLGLEVAVRCLTGNCNGQLILSLSLSAELSTAQVRLTALEVVTPNKANKEK